MTETDVLTELDDAPALPLMPEDVGIYDPLAQAGEKLAKESVVLEMHFHSPGWSKSIDPTSIMAKGLAQLEKVEGAEANGKINPERLRAAKDIIDRKELREFHRFVSKTMSKIKNRRCLASNFLANGMYVLPLECVEDVDATIEELKAGIKWHLDRVEPRWQAIIDKARVDLGPQFNEGDYPPFEHIRAAYDLETRYLSLNVPAALAQVNKAIFQKALAKSKVEQAEMAKIVRDGMRGGFLKLVSHFAERLGRDEEGKLKTFHATTAEKLKDFAKTFTDRDLVGDTDLAVLAKQVEELVEGVDPKALRSDEVLREALETKFNEIKEKASAMITVKERKLALDTDI